MWLPRFLTFIQSIITTSENAALKYYIKVKEATPFCNLRVWEPRFDGFMYIGLGGLTGSIRDQSKAAVAPATTQFHKQDPSLSPERSMEK